MRLFSAPNSMLTAHTAGMEDMDMGTVVMVMVDLVMELRWRLGWVQGCLQLHFFLEAFGKKGVLHQL